MVPAPPIPLAIASITQTSEQQRRALSVSIVDAMCSKTLYPGYVQQRLDFTDSMWFGVDVAQALESTSNESRHAGIRTCGSPRKLRLVAGPAEEPERSDETHGAVQTQLAQHPRNILV